jgi:hypothetical protein
MLEGFASRLHRVRYIQDVESAGALEDHVSNHTVYIVGKTVGLCTTYVRSSTPYVVHTCAKVCTSFPLQIRVVTHTTDIGLRSLGLLQPLKQRFPFSCAAAHSRTFSPIMKFASTL